MKQGIDQLYHALVNVVARRGLQRSRLFLTGESLGGTYMPLLAQRIVRAGKRSRIRLGGVIITAGFVDPLVQVSTTAVYAFAHGLIDASQKAMLDRVLARCRRLMRGPPPSSVAATETCFSIQDKIRKWSGRFLDNIGLTGDIDYDLWSTMSTAPTSGPRCMLSPVASSPCIPRGSARPIRAGGWTRIGVSWPSCLTVVCP